MPLDTVKYVGFDFRDAGYYTLDTEDYANSALGKLFKVGPIIDHF
jgi:hypothetical protein